MPDTNCVCKPTVAIGPLRVNSVRDGRTWTFEVLQPGYKSPRVATSAFPSTTIIGVYPVSNLYRIRSVHQNYTTQKPVRDGICSLQLPPILLALVP